MHRLSTVLFGLVVGTSACTPEAKLPNLQEIYVQAAQASADPNRPPLIAIPGILGSRLVNATTGTVLWGGGVRGISADPEDPETFVQLALPITDPDDPIAEMRDEVRPDGILDAANVEFLGIPVQMEFYGGVSRTLHAGGFKIARNVADHDEQPVDPIELARKPPEDASNAFRFDYDWRQDIAVTARRFGQFLKRRQKNVASARGVNPQDVRFDLIAHSMGGLVARYFLMYGFADPGIDGDLLPITWDGARFFSRVIFVATPNAGSVTALSDLVNGRQLGPFQPTYQPELLATYPSMYQLLPRNRHRRLMAGSKPLEDLYDPDLWSKLGWGLNGPASDQALALLLPDEQTFARRQDRAKTHTEKLLRRAERFHEMMDRFSPPPDELDLILVVGGGFETPAAGVIGQDGSVDINRYEEGDGVVLRASVLLDERLDGKGGSRLRSPLRFKTTLFLPDEHIELTKNPVFGDNLLFWLLDAPRADKPLERPRNNSLLAPRLGVQETTQGTAKRADQR